MLSPYWWEVCCATFAAALVAGLVTAPMGELGQRLAAKPAVAARPEGRSQRRVAGPSSHSCMQILTHLHQFKSLYDPCSVGEISNFGLFPYSKVDLLHALRHRGVNTRAALRRVWASEPRFLLAELKQWMKSGQQHALERAWPKIIAGASIAVTEKESKGRAKGQGGSRTQKRRELESEGGGLRVVH